MRKAGIRQRLRDLEYEVIDEGNLNSDEPEALDVENPKLRYLPEIVAVMEDLARRVGRASARGDSAGPRGTTDRHRNHRRPGLALSPREEKLGMIWPTPTATPILRRRPLPGTSMECPRPSPSAAADELVRIGGFAPESSSSTRLLLYLGARSIDAAEKKVIADIGLRVFTMEEIDRKGIYEISREAIEIASRGTEGIHVSFDVDVMDPTVAPGVGTPVRGGLTYRETHTVMELVAESGRMVSMEVAEVNPILDVANATAEVAVEMVASAFGKRIL
jgi:arginase